MSASLPECFCHCHSEPSLPNGVKCRCIKNCEHCQPQNFHKRPVAECEHVYVKCELPPPHQQEYLQCKMCKATLLIDASSPVQKCPCESVQIWDPKIPGVIVTITCGECGRTIIPSYEEKPTIEVQANDPKDQELATKLEVLLNAEGDAWEKMENAILGWINGVIDREKPQPLAKVYSVGDFVRNAFQTALSTAAPASTPEGGLDEDGWLEFAEKTLGKIDKIFRSWDRDRNAQAKEELMRAFRYIGMLRAASATTAARAERDGEIKRAVKDTLYEMNRGRVKKIVGERINEVLGDTYDTLHDHIYIRAIGDLVNRLLPPSPEAAGDNVEKQ